MKRWEHLEEVPIGLNKLSKLEKNEGSNSKKMKFSTNSFNASTLLIKFYLDGCKHLEEIFGKFILF